MFIALYITLGYFTVFFLVAQLIKNNSIVDIGWGLGFVVVSWSLWLIEGSYTVPALIVNVMISLWGLRLTYHILKRNIGKPEDFRYQNWRKAWGKWVVPRAFLQIFMLQGILQFLIGSTSYYVNTTVLDFKPIASIGLSIWLIGYVFQVIADFELKRYINLPKPKAPLLTTGLWSISRHPNYFGESLMWFGLWLYVILLGGPLYLLISPFVITGVLYFISTPILEKHMAKKEGWAMYKEKTPMFFPVKIK